MKTHFKTLMTSFLFLALFALPALADGTGNTGNDAVVTEIRQVPAFTGIDVGSAFNVYITKGEPIEVKVETEEEHLSKITTEVNGNILFIKSKGIRNANKLNIYITLPVLDYVNASGASSLKGEGTFEVQKFHLEAEGASNVSLALNTEELK